MTAIAGEIKDVKEKFSKKTELGRRRTDFAERRRSMSISSRR